MIIDGIAASEHLDSSGEILKISGHDISDLNEGRGVLNWEHNNDSSEDILGSIIFAKKIMKKSECSNDRERLYWDACGTPFVYIKAELFDNVEHPGAIAAAAMIRYYHNKGEKILAGFSIEGSTLERTDNILERSVGRRVALTLRPCNKSAISGVLEDNDIVKKYMNLGAELSNIKTVDVDTFVFEDIEKNNNDPLNELKVAISNLRKTLTAGGYNVAPSQLTGGSALQVENRIKRQRGLPKELKDKLKRAVMGWDRSKPLRDAIKAALPEVSDDYVDHFTELAGELSLKKAAAKNMIRIDPHHSWNTSMDDDQRKLITGLHMDRNAEQFEGIEMDDNVPHPSRTPILRLVNDSDSEVLVKHPWPYEDGHDPAMAGSNYYQLASNYFRLKDNVPVTNHFTHSSLNSKGRNLQAQAYVRGAHTPYHSEWLNTLTTAQNDGSAHKMALMDMILDGDTDRHTGNIIGKDGKIMYIDNGDSLRYTKPATDYPTHYNHPPTNFGIGSDLPHIDAIRWLSDLDPKRLVIQMLGLGIDKDKVKEAVRRLRVLQKSVKRNSNLFQLHDTIHPKKGRE